MKKSIKRLLTFLAVGVIGIASLGLQSTGVNAGNFSQTVFQDDFSAGDLNTQNWSDNGGNVNVANSDGALAIKTINTGYDNSITYKGYEFINENNYTIEFDASIKSLGSVWLGVVLGGDAIKGSTYEKKSDNGLVITAGKSSTSVDNYLVGVHQTNEKFDFNELTCNGVACSLKLDLRYVDNKYELDFYAKAKDASEYGEKKATLTIGGVEKYLCFQGNGENGVVKVQNLRISANGSVVASETFEEDSATLFCYTDQVDGYDWIAQDERYTSGISKVLKFDNAENERIVTSHAVVKDKNNVNNFSFAATFNWEQQTENTGFGFEVGIQGDGEGNKIYFEKESSQINVVQKNIDETAKTIATIDSLAGQHTVKIVGRYDNSIEMYLEDEKIATAKDIPFEGKVAIMSVGQVSVQVYEASLIQNTSVYSTASATENNFNVLKEGSTTQGYLDKTKWVSTGNCSIRYRDGNGFLFFNSGDVNTSFNTKEKYKDFILRFDVTRIIGTYNRDTLEAYSTEGYYSDMSIGVSMGKSEYSQSSLSGEHASIQFCPKYMLKDDQGKWTPSMIIWGYGMTTAAGKVSEWPKENWWHDGSDGKDVTNNDKLAINVMVIASNGTVSVYYKYSNQDESYLETPKAVYTNVDTYGYVAISCGYNSSFYVDNLSVVPLSFENYL